MKAASITTLFCALLLTACQENMDAGTGMDTQLATQDEFSYRVTLDRAWMEMTPYQKESYNWAVEKFTLTQLIAKYPKMTPRQVILRETEEYITQQKQSLAKIKSDLATNTEKLLQEEAMIQEVKKELEKITIRNNQIGSKKRNPYSSSYLLAFTVDNGSRFDIGTIGWDAWLLIDEEKNSRRHCSLDVDYTKNKQKESRKIPAGGSMVHTEQSIRCDDWDSEKVQEAKSRRITFQLKEKYLKDPQGKRILPVFSPTLSDYEKSIATTQKNLEAAIKIKTMALDTTKP